MFQDPLGLLGILEDGIGGAAIGVPAIAMAGGYAVSRRGPAWGRLLAGLACLAGLVTWLFVAADVGGPSFSLTTAHGLWVSTLYEGLLVTFALGAGVPHRTAHPLDVAATQSDVTLALT